MPVQLEGNENAELASAKDIRDVIAEMLSQCNIPYYRTPYDHDLHDLCIQECKLKGYPIDKTNRKVSILKYIPGGVTLACTAYGHLKGRSIQLYIALHTAFSLWMDDVYTIGVDTFSERFITGRQQANEGLDAFDRFLRQTDLYYNGIQFNMILTSSLCFVTATVLEFETQAQGMVVSPHAKSFSAYYRTLSGLGEAYSMFAFPPDIPVLSYLQAVPDVSFVLCYLNDVLSFYKEELSGEKGNYISNNASQRGVNKVAILRELANDVSLCVSRIEHTLEGEAKAAFQSFVAGYASYHISYARYHLDDLFPSH